MGLGNLILKNIFQFLLFGRLNASKNERNLALKWLFSKNYKNCRVAGALSSDPHELRQLKAFPEFPVYDMRVPVYSAHQKNFNFEFYPQPPLAKSYLRPSYYISLCIIINIYVHYVLWLFATSHFYVFSGSTADISTDISISQD